MNLPDRLSLSHSVACYALCSAITRDWRSTVTAVGLLLVLTMGVAATWLISQVSYHSGGVGRGRTEPRHNLLWSVVNLVAIYVDFYTAALRGTLLIASATSLGRWYTTGVDLCRSWILDVFLTAKKEGRFICGSTCTFTVSCLRPHSSRETGH